MEIARGARKRAFETPETASYKRQVLPQLNADLGVPADPRRLAPPTDKTLPSGAPPTMPTTTATNKKTNAQIPYARITRDAEALGVVGTPVFIRANVGDPLVTSMPDERLDAVAGVEAVNAEMATQRVETNEWRVDGVLLSTESEMDPVLEDLGVRNTATTTALLEAVQGPTQLRNLYSARPLVGDYVYLGLVWDGAAGHSWKPFSSQNLDMEFLPEQPRAPQLGFSGHVKRKLLKVDFTKEDRQRLVRAVCLGRVIDSSPSPGMITVHVSLRTMTADEMGRRHDENHVVYTTQTDETVEWEYHGDIGKLVRKSGDSEDVLKLADLLVDTTVGVGVDVMLRLEPVAAALAQDVKLVAPLYAASLVPSLLHLATRPLEQADEATLGRLRRVALDTEVFFTRVEGLVPMVQGVETLSVRQLALGRTAKGTKRVDDNPNVWLLQRAAVVAGAVDAILLSV